MSIISQKRPPAVKNKLLLITGDGNTLIPDMNRFLAYEYLHDVMCIGRSIKKYPGKVNHYVDVDCDAGKWVLENIDKTHPHAGNPVTHTLGDCAWVDVCWDDKNMADGERWHGSTGLFAVLIGLELYDVIVLAGCPMDKNGHWYFGESVPGPNWEYSDIAAWLDFSAQQRSWRVRSMSGHTAAILEKPSKAWIVWALSLQSSQSC